MKVLYATDGFEPAIDAGTLLQKIGDRDSIDVTVMSVTHAGIPAPQHMPIMLDPVPSRREDTLEIVDGAVSRLQAAGFKAAGHTAEGQPGQEADRGEFDLVAVGSRGLGPFRRALLGSVSDHVARHSRAALAGRRLVT